MENPISFGQWIKQRRKALDLTQKELARCVGYSVSALRKIESDERRPSRQIAELFAECLGIQPGERQIFLEVARGILSIDHMAPVIRDSADNHFTEPAKPVPVSNLPVQLAPLVGRNAEQAALSQMLRDPDCRLITLTGPGGNGKTRLAIESALINQYQFANGAYFVSLAALSSHEFILPAIAGALDFTFYGTADPKVQLLNFLRNKDLLLLLDGIEHLLDGVELILEILCQAPQVKLLVTSQERLNVQGEWVFEVHGLDYPAGDQVECAEGYSAVALFLQCARRARGDFSPGTDDIKWIARMCRMVDGMPLAIELAAAWIRVLSCKEIGREIERDINFLSGSARDLPERHHSLRAVFDYSWKLLTTEEQHGLCQLSVFNGGFQREAAQEVAGASLQLLTALVDKSLLQHTPQGRYDMHELVRHYAWSKLAQTTNQTEAVRNRHCRYYMGFVQQVVQHLKGPGQKEALDSMGTEMQNIRAAWEWALQGSRITALQMPIRGIWFFFDIRGRFQEAELLFRQALQALEQNTDLKEQERKDYEVLVARLCSQQGWFCMRLGRNDRARTLLEKSIQPLRCSNAKETLIDALHNLGVFYRNAGEYQRSQEIFQEALNLATQAGDDWNIARAKGNLGLGYQALGKPQEAYNKTMLAIRSYRTLGDKRMNAIELQYLGGLACELGMYESAKKNLQESLEISRAIDDPWGYGMALTQLSLVLQMQGALQDAVRLCRESLALFRELGECASILHSLNQLGQLTLALGDYYESQEAFREALKTAMKVHNLPEVLETLTGIASWLMARGQMVDAQELVELVLDNPASNKEVLDRVGKIQTVLEAEFSQEQSERSQTKTRSLESVVDEVLEKHLNIGIREA